MSLLEKFNAFKKKWEKEQNIVHSVHSVHRVLNQREEELKRTAPVKDSQRWMTAPIICEGVECENAYLPNRGGLACKENHMQVLMMSACPLGLWDRGYKLFNG
jgi:hypothetical protein